MRHLILCAFATLLWPVSGSASNHDAQPLFPQQMSANQLLVLCASSSLTAKGRLRRRYCDGFVSGIEEGLRVYSQKFPSQMPNTLCVPAGTSSRAMSEVFVKYASKKDVALDQPAAAVVIAALGTSFACQP